MLGICFHGNDLQFLRASCIPRACYGHVMANEGSYHFSNIAQNSATHPGFFIQLSAKFEKRSPDKGTKIQRKWWKIVRRGIHFTPLRKPKPLSRLGLPRLFEKRCLVINQDPFNIIWSRKTSIKSASKIRSFHMF